MNVVILGFGNVAQHLVRAFLPTDDVKVVQIYNRSEITDPPINNCTTYLSNLVEADAYIIALPDDVIPDFSEKLPFTNRLVVHTSGSVPMHLLSKKNNHGVFYPLQTFSKDRIVEFKSIPICVEAKSSKDLLSLKKLGNSISEKMVEIDSEQRRKLHLAAVFVNNFTNHLYHISEELIAENHLDFDLLKPLIFETAQKLDSLSPRQAQTGPAKRNDEKTIKNHLQILNDAEQTGNLDASIPELYSMLTQSILNMNHGEKL
jgi:predicted short-subunit dehydrogenase-like oxidoreductase (DUF2520 family)